MRASVISEHKHKYEGIRNNRTQERLWGHQQYQNAKTIMRASLITEHKNNYEGISNIRTQEQLW